MKFALTFVSCFLITSVSYGQQTQVIQDHPPLNTGSSRAAFPKELKEFCKVAMKVYDGGYSEYYATYCSENIGLVKRVTKDNYQIIGFVRGRHKQGFQYLLKCQLPYPISSDENQTDLLCEVQSK